MEVRRIGELKRFDGERYVQLFRTGNTSTWLCCYGPGARSEKARPYVKRSWLASSMALDMKLQDYEKLRMAYREYVQALEARLGRTLER